MRPPISSNTAVPRHLHAFVARHDPACWHMATCSSSTHFQAPQVQAQPSWHKHHACLYACWTGQRSVPCPVLFSGGITHSAECKTPKNAPPHRDKHTSAHPGLVRCLCRPEPDSGLSAKSSKPSVPVCAARHTASLTRSIDIVRLTETHYNKRIRSARYSR